MIKSAFKSSPYIFFTYIFPKPPHSRSEPPLELYASPHSPCADYSYYFYIHLYWNYFKLRMECWTISMTLEGKMPNWSVPTTEMTMAATIKGEMVRGLKSLVGSFMYMITVIRR